MGGAARRGRRRDVRPPHPGTGGLHRCRPRRGAGHRGGPGRQPATTGAGRPGGGHRRPAGGGGGPAPPGVGPAEARFAVIDHKTNWLGAGEEPLSAWHYRPEAMAEAMQRAHYPLQALLYSVALHRYLRWRLRGYDPDRNLAGVLYLFLRGMAGADTPAVDGQPCGVFAWRPPTALVLALSDLLDQGQVAA